VTKVGRNLIVGTGAPERIQLAELTAAAFRVAGLALENVIRHAPVPVMVVRHPVREGAPA